MSCLSVSKKRCLNGIFAVFVCFAVIFLLLPSVSAYQVEFNQPYYGIRVTQMVIDVPAPLEMSYNVSAPWLKYTNSAGFVDNHIDEWSEFNITVTDRFGNAIDEGFGQDYDISPNQKYIFYGSPPYFVNMTGQRVVVYLDFQGGKL